MKKLLLIAAAAALALSWGCSKKSSDPLEAMIGHTKTITKAMMKIIKDNKDDCNKLVTALEKYRSDHQAEFAELKKQSEEMEKSMSAEEKKKLGEKVTKKMGSLLQESMATVMELNQKCPEQAAKISAAMNVMR